MSEPTIYIRENAWKWRRDARDFWGAVRREESGQYVASSQNPPMMAKGETREDAIRNLFR